MTTGANAGRGIYLSPHSSVSAGYSKLEVQADALCEPLCQQLTGNRLLRLESFGMLAVCEVIPTGSCTPLASPLCVWFRRWEVQKALSWVEHGQSREDEDGQEQSRVLPDGSVRQRAGCSQIRAHFFLSST